mgnify:CR=1 FL=1
MNNLETIIGYTFKDKSLLNMALTHSSYANENKVKNYERLEFLGDSLLEYIVSDYIYKNFPAEKEGSLTKIRAKMVQEKTLADIVLNLGISQFVRVGRSLKNDIKQSILCDVYESLLGAIYLDSNLDNAYNYVLKTLVKDKKNIEDFENLIIDYKTPLQELCQAKNLKLDYKSSGRGDSFIVQLFVNDELTSVCKAKSIKEAEQMCAKNVYNQINKN